MGPDGIRQKLYDGLTVLIPASKNPAAIKRRQGQWAVAVGWPSCLLARDQALSPWITVLIPASCSPASIVLIPAPDSPASLPGRWNRFVGSHRDPLFITEMVDLVMGPIGTLYDSLP